MLTVEKLDRETMKLIPKEMKMFQNVDMPLFYIKWWDLDFIDKTDDEKGIWMTITLKRKIISEMMTTYLPSILLMLITFATTFFKPVYFEAALTVNLTNMLVMTTIFISVMEKLPLTSYSKLIDYWLIFCQLVPFTEVILLTAQEYIRCEQEEMKEASTQTIQRIVGPVIEEATHDIFQIQPTVTAENCPNGRRRKWMKALNTLGEKTHVASYYVFQ